MKGGRFPKNAHGAERPRHVCRDPLHRRLAVDFRPKTVPPDPVPVPREGPGAAMGPRPDAAEELHRVRDLPTQGRTGMVRGSPPFVHLLGVRDPRSERRRDYGPGLRQRMAGAHTLNRGIFLERTAVPGRGGHRRPRCHRGRDGPLSKVRDPPEEAHAPGHARRDDRAPVILGIVTSLLFYNAADIALGSAALPAWKPISSTLVRLS